jgi:hypothetical protein
MAEEIWQAADLELMSIDAMTPYYSFPFPREIVYFILTVNTVLEKFQASMR